MFIHFAIVKQSYKALWGFFSCLKLKKGVYNVGTLEFNSLSEDLSSLIKFAGTKSRIIHLPEKITITGLSLLDNLKLSPFAPWHYLTYHKPFYFVSSYVYKDLDYEPKGSNIKILEQAYKYYIDNKINPNIDSNSPHRSSLKSGISKVHIDSLNSPSEVTKSILVKL